MNYSLGQQLKVIARVGRPFAALVLGYAFATVTHTMARNTSPAITPPSSPYRRETPHFRQATAWVLKVEFASRRAQSMDMEGRYAVRLSD